MSVAADSCSELGCGDPGMSLAWTAGFVCLKGAGLPLKILLLRAERWLSGCGQLRVGVRLSYLFYLKAQTTQAGITFDHSQNPSGF